MRFIATALLVGALSILPSFAFAGGVAERAAPTRDSREHARPEIDRVHARPSIDGTVAPHHRGTDDGVRGTHGYLERMRLVLHWSPRLRVHPLHIRLAPHPRLIPLATPPSPIPHPGPM